jgi:hypothetical protein
MLKLQLVNSQKMSVSYIHEIVIPLTNSLQFGLHTVRPTPYSVKNASKDAYSSFPVTDDACPVTIINLICLFP